MTEDEVNIRCREWLEGQGYKYKGILNARPVDVANDTGYGQVPVPDGFSQVLIDHQGHNDRTKDLIWIESKGSGVNFSELLEGFIRTVYACYWGGGRGLVAVPDMEYDRLIEQREFLSQVAKACGREVGILNIERLKTEWL